MLIEERRMLWRGRGGVEPSRGGRKGLRRLLDRLPKKSIRGPRLRSSSNGSAREKAFILALRPGGGSNLGGGVRQVL